MGWQWPRLCKVNCNGSLTGLTGPNGPRVWDVARVRAPCNTKFRDKTRLELCVALSERMYQL
jgi:hypothetical protein